MINTCEIDNIFHTHMFLEKSQSTCFLKIPTNGEPCCLWGQWFAWWSAVSLLFSGDSE